MQPATAEWTGSTISPLIGVVVGGLLTWLVGVSLESLRSKAERAGKRATLEREAIAAALEWIDPMRNAQIKASSMASAACQGRFDHEDYVNRFPYLLGELTAIELNGAQRALLPDGVYRQGHEIVEALQRLEFLGIEYGQKAAVGQPLRGFDEISRMSLEMDQRICGLEDQLRAAYRATFD